MLIILRAKALSLLSLDLDNDESVFCIFQGGIKNKADKIADEKSSMNTAIFIERGYSPIPLV